MKRQKISKFIAALVTIFMAVSYIPNSIAFAEEISEDATVSYTPEPANPDLLNDVEQVEFPVEEEKKDGGIISEIIDDITKPVETKRPIFIVENKEDLPSYKYRQEQINSTNSGTYNERSIYDLESKVRNQYAPVSQGKLTVDKETGNTNYIYNIASIPGKNNSVMSLSLEYSVSDSKFVECCTDIHDRPMSDAPGDYGDVGDYVSPPRYAEDFDDSIGVGWSFAGLKREFDKGTNIYTKLRDGRMIDNTTDCYDDFEFLQEGGVEYLDGTKEYFNDKGYISYSEDKYGNRITYQYEEVINDYGRKDYRLKSVTDSLNNKITVNYYDTYIEITRPDKTKLKLNTSVKTINYVNEECNFNEPFDIRVVDNIYNVTDNASIAQFEYSHMYINYLHCAIQSDIMADDNGLFMTMTSSETDFSGCTYMDYKEIQSKKGRDPGDAVIGYPAADKVYSDSSKTTPQYTYTYSTVSSTAEGENDIKITEVTANNRVTKTYANDRTLTQEVFERNGNTDTLKSKTVTSFPKEKGRFFPSYVESKIYNSNGNYITKKTDYSYNTYGNIKTATQKVEGEIQIENDYTYYTDAYNSLKDSTVKKGTKTFTKASYTVNSLGDVTGIFLYDGDDNCQSRTVQYYDDNHNLIKKRLYDGIYNDVVQEVETEYWGAYPLSTYTKDSSGKNIAYEEYTYDTMGRMIYRANTNQTEKFTYDSLGQIIKETHKDNTAKTINYSKVDSVVSVTNENNYQRQYWYNNLGLVKRVSERTATEDAYTLQTITYDTMGNATAVKDALNNTVNITYDALGRQTSVKYPGNSQTAKAKYLDVVTEGSDKYSVYLTIGETGRISWEYYDIYGRPVKSGYIKNYSSFSASSFDNISQMPSNAQMVTTSRSVYDDLDRVIEQYDGENRPTYYTYDSVGNVINMIQGNEDSESPRVNISYEYNSAGNVTKMTQGTHVTTYEYDYAGRLTKTTDPMGYTETYTYDTAGNIKTSTDKNGVTTTNTYNNRGLLSKTSKSSEYIEYTYNGTGNPLTIKDNNGTISYTYNRDGTTASKKYPDGKTITYNTYNGNKALTSMTDYLGNTTTYTYNSRGLVTAIGEKYSGTSTTNTTNYAYNSDGSLQKITYPLSSYTTYTYDYAGRVSNLTNKLTSTSTYSTHSYTYDNSGNITQKVDTVQGTAKTTSYIYDSVNRLIKETIGGNWNRYYYDQYNNLTDETGLGDTKYYYDANNRLTKVYDEWCSKPTASGDKMDDWDITYTYDKNGTLKSSQCQSSPNCDGYIGSSKTYTYDAWGRLTNFSDSLGETASYAYYADGLRSSKTIGNNTIKYYYDGDNVINETKNGADYATNVMGINGYISRKQSGTTGYMFKDAHGDVLAAYSSTTNRLANYTYDAWGNIKSQGTQTWGESNPIRYYGQYYDTESDMTYLRARYYDGDIHRFITEDPAKDGNNWYAYCSNNPVMCVDPSGLVSVIFVANSMYEQAEIRQKAYKDMYGTECHIVTVDNALDFAQKWNSWFSNELVDEEIDAIEIISHGGVTGDVGKDEAGTAYATGFLYFNDDPNNERFFARGNEHMNDTDVDITWIDKIDKKVKQLNINGCNSANPDVYNIIYAFMGKVKSYLYTGFDGGARWDDELKDHTRGAGDYSKILGYHYVKNYQETWWKYVEKDFWGNPVRKREGRRWFWN